jgi:hypothetical protein
LSGNPLIHLALTDDWEVRGNGTGDPRVIEFEPMRQLTAIYERYGVRGSFNVELMQQLAFRRHQGAHPELRAFADEWDACVLDAFRRGHDVQPHLHPQWRDAQYKGGGKWRLLSAWSIVTYSGKEIRRMLSEAVDYLENLLRQIDPGYRCQTYRAGSWCCAPSDDLFPALAELDFVLDMSIVAGVSYDTPNIKLDNRYVEEPFLPYFPMMHDARHMSAHAEPMVCVPTHTFHGARWGMFLRDVKNVREKALRRLVKPETASAERGATSNEWTDRRIVQASRAEKLKKIALRYVDPKLHISDLSCLNFAMMKAMLRDIRSRAQASGFPVVPIILVNHPKDILHFETMDRFVRLVARSKDIRTVTLSEMAASIRAGEYRIRTSAGWESLPVLEGSLHAV